MVEAVSTHNGLVQRLWNYCNVLRDDGLSYGDYLEQLTYLLFLKMADEQTNPPFARPAVVPEGVDWPSLLERDGDALEVHCPGFARGPRAEGPGCSASSSAKRRTGSRIRRSCGGSSST